MGRDPGTGTPGLTPSERIEVTGVVQGVGFRPFVHRLATELELAGRVGNRSSVVFVEISGPQARIDEFVNRLRSEAPPLARIVDVFRTQVTALSPREPGRSSFFIAPSEHGRGERLHVPPDAATCDQCLEEMNDPGNRRFGHPFITCTNCGPRFTIIKDLPYDRPLTTMAGFAMCDRCTAEYDDPSDRRYHAQPISCHQCGPTLSIVLGGVPVEETAGLAIESGPTVMTPLEQARRFLASGKIVGVKGTGGFHLACNAANDAAVAELRRRKQRPDKPFAVMVRNLDQARRLARISEPEAAQLRSSAAPIVLLEGRSDSPVSRLVAPANPLIGVMLANNPVQHLLLTESIPALVMTSANSSGTPIVFRDEDCGKLVDLADAVLAHNRQIHVPCDDSVVRMVDGQPLPIRRARGYAPIPVDIPGAVRNVLAVGAELKNTFCLVSGRGASDGGSGGNGSGTSGSSDGHAWSSQHIGDMENLETLSAFEDLVDQFRAMYRVGLDPQSSGDLVGTQESDSDVIVTDLHPDYLSSRWAERTSTATGIGLLKVQHHHAHVCAVMAEHRLDPAEAVVGFAFDGTGYGADHSIWGGEVLLAGSDGFERVAHLRPVQLPGKDSAARTPYRSAYAHLFASQITRSEGLAPVAHLDRIERALLERQLVTGFGCTATSSMGRLFDAVASLLGLRQQISFEAQAAIDLELLASSMNTEKASGLVGYSFGLDEDNVNSPILINPKPVLRSLVRDLSAGQDPASIAWRFHRAVADMVVSLAIRVGGDGGSAADDLGAVPIVLSGGVFQNALLVSMCRQDLARSGFRPLTHRLLPANDGGLALGQAYIAATRQVVSDHKEPGAR